METNAVGHGMIPITYSTVTSKKIGTIHHATEERRRLMTTEERLRLMRMKRCLGMRKILNPRVKIPLPLEFHVPWRQSLGLHQGVRTRTWAAWQAVQSGHMRFLGTK